MKTVSAKGDRWDDRYEDTDKGHCQFVSNLDDAKYIKDMRINIDHQGDDHLDRQTLTQSPSFDWSNIEAYSVSPLLCFNLVNIHTAATVRAV